MGSSAATLTLPECGPMTAFMISFSAGEWRFHLRAAGVVRHGEFVLLHRMAGDSFWALPGGRVEVGETAEAAVQREMREELGTEVRHVTLCAVVENLFMHEGRPQHGVELHFEVALPEGSPLIGCEPFERVEDGGVGLNGDNASCTRLLFQWFHVSELQLLDLRPSFLRQSLSRTTTTGPQHIVHDERQ